VIFDKGIFDKLIFEKVIFDKASDIFSKKKTNKKLKLIFKFSFQDGAFSELLQSDQTLRRMSPESLQGSRGHLVIS
jgi:hypothetical protein